MSVLGLRSKRLQTKFLLGLSVLTLCGGLLFAGALYFHMRSILEAEVAAKGELILTQAEAVRSYVRSVLRPVMYTALGQERFIIEAMSTSYISRRVMQSGGHLGNEFTYRRVSLNPRNPEFAANHEERTILAFFHKHPTAKSWSTFKETEEGQFYVTARPVVFEASCMRCHGDPAAAPTELIERYGAKGGFGNVVGSVGGVTSVTLPVSGALYMVREATITLLIMVAGGVLFFFALANLLFNRLVVANLRRLAEVFPRYFQEQAETSLLRKLREGDEIEEVVRAVDELASHLAEARRELEDHAQHLERRVDERTRDLAVEAHEHQTDVRLFVELLAGVRSGNSRRELIQTALPKIGQRFVVGRASFVCTIASGNFFSWPRKDDRPSLPEDFQTLVASAEPRFGSNYALIPVQPTEASLEGFLFLEWLRDDYEPVRVRDVLVAVGRQLGIAMENLNVLENLMRQHDLMQTIFEGISDPLMLLDGSCQAVVANQAARELLAARDAERGSGATVAACLERLLGEVSAVDALADGDDPATDGGRPGEPPMARVKRTGSPVSYEVETGGGSAGPRTFRVNIYPLTDPTAEGGEREERYILYARESSAEKRMLARIQQSEKLVSVGKMAAGLAHEINNPLGVILCYAELLRESLEKADEPGPEDRQRRLDDIETIVHHTRNAQKVLRDLLNFARPTPPSAQGPQPAQSSSQRADSRLVAPLAVLARVCDVFEVQAAARKAKFTVELPETLPALADVRPEPGARQGMNPGLEQGLEQAVTNLLLNALDAVGAVGTVDATNGSSPERGRIRLSAQLADEQPSGSCTVRITVEDDGPGVPRELADKIFDPFFTTKDVGKGTGLGLAVVYGTVSGVGGSVEVDDSPDLGGARFTLSLPCQPDDPHQEDTP